MKRGKGYTKLASHSNWNVFVLRAMRNIEQPEPPLHPASLLRKSVGLRAHDFTLGEERFARCG
jgi:hypothetical protein